MEFGAAQVLCFVRSVLIQATLGMAVRLGAVPISFYPWSFPSGAFSVFSALSVSLLALSNLSICVIPFYPFFNLIQLFFFSTAQIARRNMQTKGLFLRQMAVPVSGARWGGHLL